LLVASSSVSKAEIACLHIGVAKKSNLHILPKNSKAPVTLGQLFVAAPALRKLLNADLPIATSYKLGKLFHQVESELKHYDQERDKLIAKHGTPVADQPGQFTFDPDAALAFNQEIATLNAIPVELSFEPVSIEKLGDIKMTAVEMASLDAFVVA
jgi:hypothetical protein